MVLKNLNKIYLYTKCVNNKKRNQDLDFNGFCRKVYNRCRTVNLGAFDFFEGVINTLLGHNQSESKYYCTENDYFIKGLHT